MKYLKLGQKGKIIAEYVWVDAAGETRSKSRVSNSLIASWLNSLFPPRHVLGLASSPRRHRAGAASLSPGSSLAEPVIDDTGSGVVPSCLANGTKNRADASPAVWGRARPIGAVGRRRPIRPKNSRGELLIA